VFFYFIFLIYIIMKNYFKYVIIFLLFLSNSIIAQTPIPIYSPNFSSAGGWQINGNAAVISNTYLRLTPNAGNQAGSAFWKQKVSLPTDFSFSTYFVSRMTPGSRADGMTFCIQQASNTAGSAGGGLGYQGIPGRSIAIEYDIYNNGEVGGNNHIALDINGVLHSGSTNVVASPVNLADGTNKHNWIEYNGTTRVLEVRISNTTTRPTAATLTVSNLNLATNFLNNTDVFFGFTAATGGATAEHGVYSAAVNDNPTPLLPTGSYSQGIASVAVTSSNNFSCGVTSTTLTVTTKDINGVGQPTLVNVTFDSGGGTLSTGTITTNSSGIGTLTYTTGGSTLTTNVVRVKEPNVGAYGIVSVTMVGTIPVGGSVSSNSHTSTTNSGTLTLSGYTGTITKWQRSTDNGTTWIDIANTTATYSYTNQNDGTRFRAVLTNGSCIINSSVGTITITFSYTTYVYNSENIGLPSIPVSIYYKLKADTNYNLYSIANTDVNGQVIFSLPYGVGLYDFRLVIDNLVIPLPTSTDVNYLVTKVLQQSFNSKDYYRFDTNNNNILNISDCFLIYYRISGGIGTWTYLIPTYRIFTETEWNTISSSNSNLKTTYPGVQTITINNLVSGSFTKVYLVRTGYKQ
jgi:hypothetical protein